MATKVSTMTEPFHIVTTGSDQGPTMQVGICVNQPLRDHLLENNITEPYMMAVLLQESRVVLQKLTPLSDGMMYVTFPRHGEYTVAMFVVYNDDTYFKGDIKRALTSKSWGSYDHPAFWPDYESELQPRYSYQQWLDHPSREVNIEAIHHFSSVSVTVEASSFAKPPAKWKAAFARWFFPDNDRDQCQLRRRTLLSIPLALFILPLHYFAKIVGLVVLSALGMVYGMRLKNCWKPFRTGTIKEMFGDVDPRRPAWFYKRDGDYDYKPRPEWFTFLVIATPIALVVATVVSLVSDVSWLASFVGVVIGVVALFTLLVIVVLLWEGLMRIRHDDRRLNSRQERKEARQQQRTISEKKKLVEELATMSCDTQGRPMTMDRLLERRKHDPVIVYHKAKERVCKPFAR